MQRSFPNVQAVERAFAVLECINRLTPCTVQEAAAQCGLPAPTVVRMLESLCELGFLKKISRRAGYTVTSRVRLLSAGFHGAPLLAEVARPYADQLTEHHRWDVSVATLDVDAMVKHYSTIAASPLAPVRSAYGKRLSLLARAHGRSYLAFCGETEQRHLLRLTRQSPDPENVLAGGPAAIAAMVKEVRAKGYATRARGVDHEHNTIAVPVLLGRERVAGTLAMTYFPKAVLPEEMKVYIRALKAAAEAIAQDMKRAIGLA